MSRTKTIDFRRVTISLPSDLIDELKINTAHGGMSSFIAGAIKDKLLEQENADDKDLVESLRQFRLKVKPKTNKSSLEVLREMRYGGKY